MVSKDSLASQRIVGDIVVGKRVFKDELGCMFVIDNGDKKGVRRRRGSG